MDYYKKLSNKIFFCEIKNMEGFMAIFISHRTADDQLANQIFLRLEQHGIKCYIDDLDKELFQRRGTAEITPFLIGKLKQCDTLLAIVTEHTQCSWWVPFEIGTAREMPRIITSYTSLGLDDYALPEYLLEWPRLHNQQEIDTFARMYKKKSQNLYEGIDFSVNNNGVRQFESSVMTALNQRNYV
jgi:hypothetical protein